MSVPYYIEKRQSNRITNQELLKQQVLDKVVMGLIAASLISLFITQLEQINIGIYYLAFVAEIVIIIASIFAREESTLEKLYYAFVVATAVTLGVILQIFLSIPGGLELVGNAFASTTVIVGGIYYYTSVNRPDTSNMIKYLLPATLLLFVIFIVGFFIAFSNTFYMLLSLGGAILFSLYLFYDLGRLMNGQYQSPARMAFMIYWDIILIFKYLLNFLFFMNRD